MLETACTIHRITALASEEQRKTELQNERKSEILITQESELIGSLPVPPRTARAR